MPSASTTIHLHSNDLLTNELWNFQLQIKLLVMVGEVTESEKTRRCKAGQIHGKVGYLNKQVGISSAAWCLSRHLVADPLLHMWADVCHPTRLEWVHESLLSSTVHVQYSLNTVYVLRWSFCVWHFAWVKLVVSSVFVWCWTLSWAGRMSHAAEPFCDCTHCHHTLPPFRRTHTHTHTCTEYTNALCKHSQHKRLSTLSLPSSGGCRHHSVSVGELLLNTRQHTQYLFLRNVLVE